MLSDPRSTALFTGFFDTWLSLDQLTTMKGDSKLFPEFDDELRRAFRRETELFVESQLREDRSSLDPWTANYTFLNERLARHWDVANDGKRFLIPVAEGTVRAVNAAAPSPYKVILNWTSTLKK